MPGSIDLAAGTDVFSFADGSDKITLVGFGFTSSGNPALSTSNGNSFGADESIVTSADTTNNLVEVYLNAAGGGGYAKITVNGVTTLDLNDFEFS